MFKIITLCFLMLFVMLGCEPAVDVDLCVKQQTINCLKMGGTGHWMYINYFGYVCEMLDGSAKSPFPISRNCYHDMPLEGGQNEQ